MSDLITNSKNYSITCALLDGSPNNNMLLKYPSLNVGDFSSTTILLRKILIKLKADYPGVNTIKLYLKKDPYHAVFGTERTEEFVNLLLDTNISEEQKNLLLRYTIYIKITNLYDIEDEYFTSIKKFRCTFKTLDNKSSFVNLLLPDVSLPVDRFKQILMDYMKHMKLSIKIDDRFKLRIEDKNGKTVDNITGTILKDINITLVDPLNSFEDLSNSIPAFKKEQNDEEQLKNLLHDFYKPGISFHTYLHGNKRLLIGFPSEDILKNNYSKLSYMIGLKNDYSSHSHIFGLIGPSGCGKTSTLYELGKQFPLVYVNVNNPCFSNMLIIPAKKIELDFYNNMENQTLYQKNNAFLTKLNIMFSRFFYAVYIYFHRRHFKDQISNTDLINEQFNGASHIIENIWNLLDDKTDYTESFRKLLKEYHSINVFNIAFDEAQILCKTCCNLLSNSFVTRNLDLTTKSSHESIHQRHLYYALTKYFIDLQINTLFAGTSFLLNQCTEFISNIGKGSFDIITIISDFGLCTEPMKVLKQTIKIDDIDISADLQQKIEKRRGNWRFTFSIINEIINAYLNNANTNNKSKLQVFTDAINDSEKRLQNTLNSRNPELKYITDIFKDKTQLLLAIAKSVLFVEYSNLKEINLIFKANELDICCDLFHISNVEPSMNSNEYTANFFLYEPIIKEALGFNYKTFSEYLQKECINITPVFYFDGSSQGKLFELICLYQLCHFNGILVSDLPFVKNIPNLPQWAQKTTLLAKLFGQGWEYFNFFNFDQLDKSSNNSNCYPDQNGNFYSGMLATEYDAKFISQSKDFVGCVLKPQNLTRPDGFLPMITNDNEEIHPLLLGIKCYSSQLSNDIINDNTNTTDPDLLFTQSNNKNPKQTEKARRILYPTKEKKPLFQGSLRVHILLSPNEINNKSYVNNNGDILVYITKNNLNEFFDFKTQKYLKNYFNRLCSIITPEQKQNSKKTNQSSQKKSTKRKLSLASLRKSTKKRKLSSVSPQKTTKSTKQTQQKTNSTKIRKQNKTK